MKGTLMSEVYAEISEGTLQSASTINQLVTWHLGAE